MRLLLLILFPAITYSQNTQVSLYRIDKDNIYGRAEYSITLETEELEIDSLNKIRLTDVMVTDEKDNIIYTNVNAFNEYYDSDNLVDAAKNTFEIKALSDYSVSKINIKGKLNYYQPTFENKAIHEFKNPLSKLGTNLAARADSKVTVLFLDAVYLYNLNKETPLQYDKNIKALQKKHHLAPGELKQAMTNYFSNLEIMDKQDRENIYLFYISGEKSRVARILFYNVGETSLRMEAMHKTNTFNLKEIRLLAKPENWKLYLYLETDAAISTYNFEIKDITTP